MKTDYRAFFQRFVGTYNTALAGKMNVPLIRSFYFKHFMMAMPEGVKALKNGMIFSMVLHRSSSFYKKIGTEHMAARVEKVTPIDPLHDLVKVTFTGTFRKKDGKKVVVSHSVSYVFRTKGGLKIIFFVSGDEMGAYKKAGLV